MRVLVTGGAGLVGTECCKLFASEGFDVVSIDNYMRARIFGADAETKDNIQQTRKHYRIEHHELDIRHEKAGELLAVATLDRDMANLQAEAEFEPGAKTPG